MNVITLLVHWLYLRVTELCHSSASFHEILVKLSF